MEETKELENRKKLTKIFIITVEQFSEEDLNRFIIALGTIGDIKSVDLVSSFLEKVRENKIQHT